MDEGKVDNVQLLLNPPSMSGGDKSGISDDEERPNGSNIGKCTAAFSFGPVLVRLERLASASQEQSELRNLREGGKYVGQIVDGMRHGDGAWVCDDGSVVYSGDWKDNLMDGEGAYNFATGSYYHGSWKEGVMCGKGVYKSISGWVYGGMYKDSRRNGHGILEQPDGLKYEGEWRDDAPHGRGCLVLPDGSQIEGEFVEGMLVSGEGQWSNGDTYSGDWKDGYCDGEGRAVVDSRTKEYYGKWRRGLPNGKGVLHVLKTKECDECADWYGEGYTCEAVWENGLICGLAKETLANGTGSFVGEYLQGMKHGRGLLQLTGHGLIEGVWWHGELTTALTPQNGAAGQMLSSTDMIADLMIGEGELQTYHMRFPQGQPSRAEGGPALHHEESTTEQLGRRSLSSSTSFSWTSDDDQHSGDEGCIRSCKLVYPNNTVYCGDVDVGANEPHGRGEVVCAGGDRFEGVWNHGQMVGDVTYDFTNGGRYVGGVVQGQKQGKGKLILETSSYQGEWEKDKPDGFGVFKDSIVGTEYEGEWKSGMMNGVGTLKMDGWGCYKGCWANNKRHGNGKLTAVDGSCYDGNWVEDKASGFGRYTWSDSNDFEGEWLNNEIHGKGTMRTFGETESGERVLVELYVGEWEHNCRSGNGEMKFSDGSYYRGEWKNNRPHGNGLFVNFYGVLFRGVWTNGILDPSQSTGLDLRGLPTAVVEGSSYQLEEDLRHQEDSAENNTGSVGPTSATLVGGMNLLDSRVLLPLPDPGSKDVLGRMPRPRVFTPDDAAGEYYQEESSSFQSTVKPLPEKKSAKPVVLASSSGYMYHARFAAEYWTHSFANALMKATKSSSTTVAPLTPSVVAVPNAPATSTTTIVPPIQVQPHPSSASLPNINMSDTQVSSSTSHFGRSTVPLESRVSTTTAGGQKENLSLIPTARTITSYHQRVMTPPSSVHVETKTYNFIPPNASPMPSPRRPTPTAQPVRLAGSIIDARAGRPSTPCVYIPVDLKFEQPPESLDKDIRSWEGHKRSSVTSVHRTTNIEPEAGYLAEMRQQNIDQQNRLSELTLKRWNEFQSRLEKNWINKQNRAETSRPSPCASSPSVAVPRPCSTPVRTTGQTTTIVNNVSSAWGGAQTSGGGSPLMTFKPTFFPTGGASPSGSTRQQLAPIRYVEVPVREETNITEEVEIVRKIPVPVEVTTVLELKFPKIRRKVKEISYPVFVPRYVDVPIPAEQLSPRAVEICDMIKQELEDVTSGLKNPQMSSVTVSDYENIANKILDLYDQFGTENNNTARGSFAAAESSRRMTETATLMYPVSGPTRVSFPLQVTHEEPDTGLESDTDIADEEFLKEQQQQQQQQQSASSSSRIGMGGRDLHDDIGALRRTTETVNVQNSNGERPSVATQLQCISSRQQPQRAGQPTKSVVPLDIISSLKQNVEDEEFLKEF